MSQVAEPYVGIKLIVKLIKVTDKVISKDSIFIAETNLLQL